MTTEPAIATESTTLSSGHNAQIGAIGGVVGKLASGWARVEPWLVRAGDLLNPILVKETRQALKSRQFVMTFLLVLIACWIATIVGVASIGPAIFYAAAGGTLLFWYYVILAFPLAIVVPYSAFRSLAAEREDNTYDLLSITTLSPRQIISGKLGSSVAQMAIYFSAVAPCLAFTYLLRGIDVPTIALILVYTFLGSLGLSMIGLFLATLSKQRYSQIFISVLFVSALSGAFILALMLTFAVLTEGPIFVEGFVPVFLACLTIFVTTFALIYFAAASMITFSSENRSTPLRIVMLLQQACWIGWLGFIFVSIQAADAEEVALVMIAFAGIYWYVMGLFLTSERALMSDRVKRRLPKSFLGRTFFTWLNPGPASGFMFVIANATTIATVALIGIAAGHWLGKTTSRPGALEQVIYLTVVGFGFLVSYLGIGLLLISACRKFAAVPLVGGVLIHLLVLMAGTLIPWTIQMMSVNLRELDYSFLQITNPFWSLYHLTARGLPIDAAMLLLTVSAAAVCVLVLNLPGVVRELRQTRVALPARVAEDELALHPLPLPGPTNPWDEPVSTPEPT